MIKKQPKLPAQFKGVKTAYILTEEGLVLIFAYSKITDKRIYFDQAKSLEMRDYYMANRDILEFDLIPAASYDIATYIIRGDEPSYFTAGGYVDYKTVINAAINGNQKKIDYCREETKTAQQKIDYYKKLLADKED